MVLVQFFHGAFPVLSYIDPGTGSRLFTVLISIIGAAIYSLRLFAVKLRNGTGRKRKIDKDRVPFVFFSDNKRYWSVYLPVIREMSRRGLPVLYLTASEDDPAFECAFDGFRAEYIGPEKKMFSRINSLSAVIMISTTPGLDVYQWKRSAGVKWYVHIPHTASELILYRMFGIDYYDAILLSGKYQEEGIRQLEELRHLPAKELVMMGIPYMDDMAERVKAAGPVPAHERTVLLAPTWGVNSAVNVFGTRLIDALLETGYHIVFRPHPQSFISEKELMDDLMKRYPQQERFEWNRDADNFEVLRRSDIMISDYSGVLFEYTLVHDKPVIYATPEFDLDPYDAWWLKQPLWTQSALPLLGHCIRESDLDDMKSLIDRCIDDVALAEGRAEVKRQTWEKAGEGAVICVDYLQRKYEELTKEED